VLLSKRNVGKILAAIVGEFHGSYSSRAFQQSRVSTVMTSESAPSRIV
jgi:hypothetical protein